MVINLASAAGLHEPIVNVDSDCGRGPCADCCNVHADSDIWSCTCTVGVTRCESCIILHISSAAKSNVEKLQLARMAGPL